MSKNTKIADPDTRFYIDIDLKNKKIINYNHGQRQNLEQLLSDPNVCRIFITFGQFNKLKKGILFCENTKQ